MHPEFDSQSRYAAIQDFRRARNQAVVKDLFARLTGESTQLLSYDEVLSRLRIQGSSESGLKEIPLDAIIGSVGRYNDFTRDFLPREAVSQNRWARIMELTSSTAGLPPIEVYQVGEAYFVKDGNHRVSVARSTGASHIQAYVTKVQTRIPVTANMQPEDLILLAEYSEFLENTRIDTLRPQSDLRLTVPGQYQSLMEHIDVHRYFMGQEQQREISYEEAVTHWYDVVYLPVVQILREAGVMHHFPERTEADLYVWLSEHRAQLEEQLGWTIKTEYAASHLVGQFSEEHRGWLDRIGRRIQEIAVSEKLEAGPPTGSWRTQLAQLRQDCLFPEILVPLNGKEEGWCAFEQALVLALRERSRLNGLHIVATPEEESAEASLAVKEEFEHRCQDAGVEGKLIINVGEPSNRICQSAHFNDLVVVNLAHPPADQPAARLSSGFRDLLLHCSRPILATPHTVSSISRALLAYDGSQKAREALFVAAYIAGEWHLPLVVLTISEGGKANQDILDQAREYLETLGIQAEYILAAAPVAEAIKWTAAEQACDFVLMGGYGKSPVVEILLGSQVDQVLRETHIPVLICR